MNILIAPDKFKGSLTARQVCDAISEGIKLKSPDANITCLPLADGGEGTTELLTSYSGGSMIKVVVRDPLFREIHSGYGISSDGKTAFLEMAKASGLQLLKKEERNPSLTSTIGTGELIRHTIDRGVEQIVMGIGGSATNDGGMGMGEALGLIFYSATGERLKPIGKNLQLVHRIDDSTLHQKLRDMKLTFFCDVDNPLHGLHGAAYVFARQKGADDKMIEELNEGLVNYERVLKKTFGVEVNFPGAGAGGGLPATLKALTNVSISPGMEFIIDFIRLEDQIRRADVVITGEGKIDEQTLSGKVVKGVTDLSAKHNKPVIAVAGKNELSESQVQTLNLSRLVTLVDEVTSDEQAMSGAYDLIIAKISRVWNP